MLFGNESISTFTKPNMTIWMALAFQGGMLNMGGYLACHSFVSHVTGFGTLFGFEWSQSHYLMAAKISLVPLFFLSGSALSGYLVDLRIKLHKRPKYFIVFGVLLLLTLLIVIGGFNGLFGPFGQTHEQLGGYILLILLCLTCGVQNGTVTSVSRHVVRTTHLTGITTDLGIGLVRVLNRRRLQGQIENEGKANFMRAGVIFFFALGSMVGALMFNAFAYRGFLLPTAISGTLFFLTFYFQVLRRT